MSGRKVISTTTNKTEDGLTEKQVIAIKPKKKKRASKDIYGKPIFKTYPAEEYDDYNTSKSAFDK